MSESIDEKIRNIFKEASNNREKGTLFEKLSKHLLKKWDTAGNYKEIFLWNKWDKRDGADRGIDLVIETREGKYIAVQCKAYGDSKVSHKDLSPYFTQLQSGVGDIEFSEGIIITTSDFTDNAEKDIEQISKKIPISKITQEEFRNSDIDWEELEKIKFQKSLELPIKDKKRLREHQEKALKETEDYFRDSNNTRGKLIMACGTGKTFTSLRILERITEQNSIVLFLAPSIALVAQTFREYYRERNDDFYACIVCSDNQAGNLKAGNLEDDIKIAELPKTPSTKIEDIGAVYKQAQNAHKRLIIFSTYQSARRIKEAQEAHYLGTIDLMICDEAHRTVGISEKDKDKEFTLCHSDTNIRANKRIYMSATPLIFNDRTKNRASENECAVFSMDDPEIFGKEIYKLSFSEAIEKKLLTDYKVIILAIKQEAFVSITNKVIVKLKTEENCKDDEKEKLFDLNFVCKIIGMHKGLARKDLMALNEQGLPDNDFLNELDKNQSKRVINFCRSIKASKHIIKSFKTIMECYDEELKQNSFADLKIESDHVDGAMDSGERLKRISKLEAPEKDHVCRLLSNARCLNEGVDIPALDTVVFFDAKQSMIDIVQSVGRVMRRAEGKKIGYIILPLALSESELRDVNEALKNTNFNNTWRVLQALRSHDDRLLDERCLRDNIKICAVGDNKKEKLNPKDDKQEQNKPRQETMDFPTVALKELADAMYNVMPTKLGDKGYWQNFTAKTAKIVERLNARLDAIFREHPEILKEFHNALKENIHPYVREDEAVDMICSHIITKPIFDVLFDKEMDNNPISKALNEVSTRLNTFGLDNEETKSLSALYSSVEENAKKARSEKNKQELIKNLYDTFFRAAFKKQAQRLGIVYTPIEVVDFILHSINELLKKHFNTDFNDKEVKIFDPFMGTGSFITRLLSKENNLIRLECLKDKIEHGIFAQDIILLAYYIALINITQTAQTRLGESVQFKKIALGDSLDYKDKNKDKPMQPAFSQLSYLSLKENKDIQDLIGHEKIKVILGNPPYSAGSKSENDNNANLSHPFVEERVKETYPTTAQSAKNTRDTLIQPIRMASDRLIGGGGGHYRLCS